MRNERLRPRARKDYPNNAFEISTRYAIQQRANKLRPAMLKIRDEIPPIFGISTYIFSAIAANGGVLRQTDINISLGASAAKAAVSDKAGMLRTFRMQTQQGPGPRGIAVLFDKTFPLAKEVLALARKIGKCHPFPIENKMPKEVPPRPLRGQHRIDLIAGSEINTLVLATVRAVRGKVGLVELQSAVPYPSLTAVQRSVQRLRDCGILDVGEGGAICFKDEPWKRELENLFERYLRIRPELRKEIRARTKIKKKRRADRSLQCLFGYESIQRVLTALAIHGPMPRTELASITMLTHQNIALNDLRDAGILTLRTRRASKTRGTKAHDSRAKIFVGLNAACPIYRELRVTLLALAGEPAKSVRRYSEPRDGYDIDALFNTAPLFWALLMMNALPGGELDVASLNRLRPQHAPFTLHGRMHWLLEQGIAKCRQEGLIKYYGLNPAYRAYKPLKRLLDKIGKAWPDLVAAAVFNDDIKSQRRLTVDRNAGKRKRKIQRATR